MAGQIPQNLILLTYKNKALLVYWKNGPLDEGQHVWSFIEGSKKTAEDFEDSLVKDVEQEMGIRIEHVEYISKSCYHASLTDDNVNQIQRAEGQLLDFFTLDELSNLSLSEPTRDFISKHQTFIGKLL